MLSPTRIDFLVAGVICAAIGVTMLQNRKGSFDQKQKRRSSSQPRVEELAAELQNAWADRHTP